MRAVLSSGSNMGDARAHLQTVADEFAGDTLAASSIYATAPWGNTDQPDFLNQSLLVDVDDTPHGLASSDRPVYSGAKDICSRRATQ